MTRLLRLSVIFAVSATTACAPAWIPGPVADRQQRVGSRPDLNRSATAEVGDNLYTEFKVVTKQTATLTEDANGSLELGHRIALPAGKAGELQKHSQYGWKMMCFQYVTVSGVGGPAHTCLVDVEGDGTFDKSMFTNRDKYFDLDKKAAYSCASDSSSQDITDGFKREALYQGVSKGSVKVSFREFINSMARPAFTQDISYDLEPDGTTLIAFQGLRIRVLRASSSGIEYIVEKPFRGSLVEGTPQ